MKIGNILRETLTADYKVGHPEWNKTHYRGFDAGGKIKEVNPTYWDPPNYGATNSSGFTARGAGKRGYYEQWFGYLGEGTSFWDSDQLYWRSLWYQNQNIGRQGGHGRPTLLGRSECTLC